MTLKQWRSKPIRLIPLLLLFVLIILLAACTNNTPKATRDVVIGDVQITVVPPTEVPYLFKTSEPGAISVHGDLVILNPMSMIPADQDSIFLAPMATDAPISGVPQFEVGTVPQADVNEVNGEFMFTNIQPGQYAVVAITVGGAQIPVRYMETASYAIVTLDASQVDTTVELGKLTLP